MPTTLISSLPLRARACMDCGYVAMMIGELSKLHKLAARDEKADEKIRQDKGFKITEDEVDESLDAIQQMEADQPKGTESQILEDLDMTAEEEDRRTVEALETLADVPPPEAADEEGPLKDLANAAEPEDQDESTQE
jgi:hypothetical protein